MHIGITGEQPLYNVRHQIDDITIDNTYKN